MGANQVTVELKLLKFGICAFWRGGVHNILVFFDLTPEKLGVHLPNH
jgi:hypothetical protein